MISITLLHFIVNKSPVDFYEPYNQQKQVQKKTDRDN